MKSYKLIIIIAAMVTALFLTGCAKDCPPVDCSDCGVIFNSHFHQKIPELKRAITRAENDLKNAKTKMDTDQAEYTKAKDALKKLPNAKKAYNDALKKYNEVAAKYPNAKADDVNVNKEFQEAQTALDKAEGNLKSNKTARKTAVNRVNTAYNNLIKSPTTYNKAKKALAKAKLAWSQSLKESAETQLADALEEVKDMKKVSPPNLSEKLKKKGASAKVEVAKMKEGGLKFIGDVPKGWEFKFEEKQFILYMDGAMNPAVSITEPGTYDVTVGSAKKLTKK